VEAGGEADRKEGVLYTVTCNSDSDSDSEILLHLRKEEELHEIGVSGRQYALVPEGVWLRTLKRWVIVMVRFLLEVAVYIEINLMCFRDCVFFFVCFRHGVYFCIICLFIGFSWIGSWLMG